MPHWVRVANAADIPLNKSVAVEVAGHSLLIARLEDGFCALRNMCSHQAQPLQGGADRRRRHRVPLSRCPV
jgi:nitrite reductase/ring-hydroxylating ferredoxin subunit